MNARPDLETAGVINTVVSMLSLQPADSPAHNVEVYREGLRIPVTLTPTTPDSEPVKLYVYALPWSRGWSVFTTTADHEPVGAHSWRDVPYKYKGMQRAIYNPRYRLGPWNTAPSRITDEVIYLLNILDRLNQARQKRLAKLQAKPTWYWHPTPAV